MTNARHADQDQTQGIHASYTWLWADTAARTAQTGVTQAQVDAACTGLQLDEDTVWRATDIVPTWRQIGSGGAAANQHVVNPASNDVIVQIVESIRNTSAAPQNGIGGSYDIKVEHSGGEDVAGRFAAAWQDESGPTSAVLITGSQGGVDRVVIAVGPPGTSGGSQPTPDEVVAAIGPGSIMLMPTLNEIAGVPTGISSAFLAGEYNEGAGDYGVIAGGRDNQLNSPDSLVSGRQSVSRFPASRAHASGNFVTPGDCQPHEFVMKVVTTDNTPTPLLDDGANSISFADDTRFVIKLDVLGTQVNDETFTVHYQAWIKGYCSAGTATIADSATVVSSEGPAGVFNISWAASTNEVVISVEGHVTETTYWMARVIVLEIIV